MGDMIMQKKRTVKNNLSVKNIESYLKEKGFNVPKDFEKEVGVRDYLYSEKDLKEVSKITEFWRPYVGEELYNEFVINIYKKFLRIQCVAINSNPNCRKLFVGDFISSDLEGIPLMKELVTTRFSKGGNAVSDHPKYRIEN